MKTVKLHIAFYFILIWNLSFSQQFTNLSTTDGLPSNHIYKIAQDVNGFIWFASDKGLVKYNGNTMKSFTTRNGLTSNDVWGIHPTSDGKLWYLSKASKLGYIYKDSVYTFESENKNEIFNSNYTSQVGNEIILTSNNTSYKLVDNKWRAISNQTSLNKTNNFYIEHPIIISLETSVASGTFKIVYKNGKKKNIKNGKNILNSINYRGQITDSLFYWTGEKEYSILNLNTAKIYRRNFKDEIGIDNSQHTRINIVNNQIQITGRGFVGILDSNYHITKEILLSKKLDAHFALIDKNETVWISTFKNGVYQYPKAKQNIKYFFKNEKILKINNLRGKIIANIYNKGFYKYNPINKNFTLFIKAKEYVFSSQYIDSLETEFYVSENKIIRKKNEKTKVFNFSKSSFYTNEVARKLVFFNGFLYGNNSIGLNKINDKKLNTIKSYYQESINDLIVYNNNLLIATANGLKQFKNEKISDVSFNNSGFNKSILSITKISETHLLLNTDGFGSYITDLNKIHQLPKSEFLIVNNAFVEKNTLWLATNSGVLKYSKQHTNYTLKKTVMLANGLPSNHVNDIAVVNNDLIVSTNIGVAILPKNQKNISQVLDIYIEKVDYNNHIIKKDNSAFKYKENNNISITVSNIDFSENNANFSYYYKLEPFQNKWNITNTSNINFNNLKPNKYVFRIKANTFYKEIKFTILPLWYQTIWFKILSFLLLLSLFFSATWYLSKRNQKQKSEQILKEKQLSEIQLKALRSQMNPHFVFNSLAAIQYYINENNFEASEKYLVKFSKLIRQFFELSKETTITINEEVKLLTNYLEIEKLRFKEKLSFNINTQNTSDLGITKIPTMLLQPIVENAVNHGIFNKLDKGTISINFSKINSKTYKVLIIDDGVGFINAKSKNKKIRSSNVLQERLTYLNTLEKWDIKYFTEELYPKRTDKGNKSTFIIKRK